jgi:hypothetical protein
VRSLAARGKALGRTETLLFCEPQTNTLRGFLLISGGESGVGQEPTSSSFYHYWVRNIRLRYLASVSAKLLCPIQSLISTLQHGIRFISR